MQNKLSKGIFSKNVIKEIILFEIIMAQAYFLSAFQKYIINSIFRLFRKKIFNGLIAFVSPLLLIMAQGRNFH